MNEIRDKINECESLKNKSLISLGYRGSHAHGMYVPPTDPNSVDDIDLLGVFLFEPEFYTSLVAWNTIDKKSTVEQWFNRKYDCVFYELKKMLLMLLGCNPNVLSYVWTNDEDYIFNSDFQVFVKNRHWFVSKLAYKTFGGYARTQLKKMTSFEKHGFMGKKRKALVDQFGYDVKNAAHLIRLLKMGIEILRTGEVIVKRTEDREFLLDIKKGKFKLAEIKQYADDLFNDLDVAYASSELPEETNRDEVEIYYQEIMEDWLF